MPHTLFPRFLWGLFLAILLALPGFSKSPDAFTIEAFVATIDSETNTKQPLKGSFNMTFELLKSDGSTVLTKSYPVVVSMGILTIDVTEEDNFDTSLFSDFILSARITLKDLVTDTEIGSSEYRISNANLDQPESIDIPIYSINRSILSNTSYSTNQFYNENLISVSESSLNVAIATTNLIDTLHVDGVLQANAFIGDGSNLLNLDYIRWKSLYERIYYDNGAVGIGLTNPLEALHVSGDIVVTQSPLVEAPPLLVIQDSLIATFNGGAQQISSFNASEFTTGNVGNERIFGDYLSVTGLGVVDIGTWNAKIIDDSYVQDNLTIQNSHFENPSINGQIVVQNTTEIISHSHLSPIVIDPPHWTLTEHPTVSLAKTYAMSMSSTDLITELLDIRNGQVPIISMNSSGNIALANTTNIVEFNPSGAIQVGHTTQSTPGTFRLAEYFEAYSSSGWKRMDMLGNFTGFSLFREEDLVDEVIKIKSNGNIGIDVLNPIDHIVISGNVVFEGHPRLPDPSSEINTGNYWVWVANKGSLRIGESTADSQMNSIDNIGAVSVAMGKQSAATNIGAVNITSPSANSRSLVSGVYSVNIAGNLSTISGDNSLIFGSSGFNTAGDENIMFSGLSYGLNITGSNNIFLNGTSAGVFDSNHSIIGGVLTSAPPGDYSFIWDVWGQAQYFTKGSDYSFVIGPQVKVGINTNEFESVNISDIIMQYGSVQPDMLPAILSVGGMVAAPFFDGDGSTLTGNIITEYLKVSISGVTENIYPTTNLSPKSIYVSDENGFVIENSVNSQSIADGSIIGSNIDGYSLETHKIMNESVGSSAFANSSITIEALSLDDLGSVKFSNITGDDFEDHSIDETKLANYSIMTIHFVDEAVTTVHIDVNTVNSPINNIGLHQVTTQDMIVELLESKYFANRGIVGEDIADQALFTITDNTGIVESYFVWKVDGNPAPQIQEQHIAENAIKTFHILPDSIDERTLAHGTILSEDLTQNITAGTIIADDRTVDDVVFIGRHFADDAVTNGKFQDSCPASGCTDPSTRFQLTSLQITDNAIAFDGGGLHDELNTASVVVDHIVSKNITGRHIKENSVGTIKFKDASIFNRHLNDDSISSTKIKNNALQIQDFSQKSIHGVHIVTASITSRELADNSISKDHLEDNVIFSNHIVDKSLQTIDFVQGAITSDKVKGGSVATSKIADDAIIARHTTNLILSFEKFVDNGVSWDDFIRPPDDYFPSNRFGNNSLNYAEKFMDDNINGSAFVTGSISAQQLNIPTFSVEKLAAPLDVTKGGTGITSFVNNAVLYIFDDNGTTKMGQSSDLRWFSSDPTNSKPSLYISPPDSIPGWGNGSKGLVMTSGNILIENGKLILKDWSEESANLNGQYTFLTYNSTDAAIQISHKLPLTSTNTNMNLKTKTLEVGSKLLIGSGNSINGLDLYSGFRLGTTYYNNDTNAPSNGMIIEGSMQIGGVDYMENAPTYKLQIHDGIASSVSTNYGIIADSTGETNPIPIKSIGRTVEADAPIGISTEAPSPIKVTISSEGGSKGIDANVDGSTLPAAGIHLEMAGASSVSINSYLGYTSAEFSAGVYSVTPNSTLANNYAALFNGNLLTKHLSSQSVTPTQNLNLKSLKMDGVIAMNHQDNILTTIDWEKGNVVNLDIDDNNRNIIFTTVPEKDTKLIVLVKHSGRGEVRFTDPNIKWIDDYEPELTSSPNATDIVVFTFQTDGLGGGTYYGGAAYNFY